MNPQTIFDAVFAIAVVVIAASAITMPVMMAVFVPLALAAAAATCKGIRNRLRASAQAHRSQSMPPASADNGPLSDVARSRHAHVTPDQLVLDLLHELEADFRRGVREYATG